MINLLLILGPENWSKIYKKCDGKRQSPINIKTKNVLKNRNLTLRFGSAWKSKSKLEKRGTRLIISNSGHAVELDIKTQEQHSFNPIFTYEGGEHYIFFHSNSLHSNQSDIFSYMQCNHFVEKMCFKK